MKQSILIVALFFSIPLTMLFLWSPVAHYLGMWDRYWDVREMVERETAVNSHSSESDAYYERRDRADEDCEERAIHFFSGASTTTINSFPVTTDDYQTYECYGIKYDKIP